MLEAVTAVERGGASVFGLGFKTVTPRGDVFLDELKKYRAEALASEIFLYIYFLDPYDSSARLLGMSVGKNAVADGLTVLFKNESGAVWRAREEKLEGVEYIIFGNIFKHRGRGIKIPRHFGVEQFVVFSDFSDCHF